MNFLLKRSLQLMVFIPFGMMAATVWTGPQMSFSSDNVPDKLTDHVWLTRGASMGLYNSKVESGFTRFYSPADTEWANGTTADYASLSFTDWNTWAKVENGGPPGTVGVDAVLHLISEDIYIDIKFTTWFQGTAFSYVRSTPAVVTSVPPLFQSFSKTGETTTLTWSATSSQSYQLQYATNLVAPNWINVGAPITATSDAITATDTNATAAFPQRFYRVFQLP